MGLLIGLAVPVRGTVTAYGLPDPLRQAVYGPAIAALLEQPVNADIQYVAMGLIIAFTLIAAVNTLIMAVLSRRGEFALLLMIGATRSQIRRLARWETLVVTLVAVAAGTLISLITLIAFARGVTGSWTPAVPAAVYLAVVACVAIVTFLTTEAAARSALRPPTPQASSMRNWLPVR